ncbi:MAG: di-trans,poly-cis-decaprenylcistransferase [Clostridia bacterium]|nr:di-trans,poly-cis-decaprenylcistransferase [Clostridia bacterium]
MDETIKIPTHVGIIMDGNGRWAKSRLMPRSFGHKAGMQRMIELAEYAKELGVKYLTVYALSTENMQRPQEELDGLYSLFTKYFTKNVEKLFLSNAAVKIIGDVSALPENVQALICDAQKKSPDGADFTFTIALNYGGRAEILQAVNKAVERGEKVNEQTFSSMLYTGETPYPDLIIRTGKEQRLSNFLIWQAAYAELYFTEVLFPDFTNAEFYKAILNYSKRDRRFGKL